MSFYQGMTKLPEELERALLEVPQAVLVGFIHTSLPVIGTDTVYTAVQIIAREFSEAKIRDFLKEPGAVAPITRAPVPDKPKADSTPNRDLLPHRPPKSNRATARSVSSTQHPQAQINAKSAAAKELGGGIAYTKGTRNWTVSLPDGTQTFWTSAEFRDTSIEEVQALMKLHKS